MVHRKKDGKDQDYYSFKFVLFVHYFSILSGDVIVDFLLFYYKVDAIENLHVIDVRAE